jgi:hypothetical protein
MTEEKRLFVVSKGLERGERELHGDLKLPEDCGYVWPRLVN